MIDAAGGPLVVTLRFLALAATIGTLGAWVFGRFVAGQLVGEAGENHRTSLQNFSVRTAIWCTALLALSAAPRLLAQAAAFAEPGDPLWPNALLVLRTHWGWALAAQAITAAMLGAALVFGRRQHAWPLLAEVCVAGLVVMPAFQGHAGAAQDLRALSVLVDVVHLAAAGGWVGTLGILTAVTLRERRAADGPTLTAALIVAFHPVAMVSAAAVFITGLGTAWLRMGVPVGIASSSYSGLFVAKLLLVGVTGAIGAGHSKQAKRRVQAVDLRSISRSLVAETLLAVLVLAVTAILAGTDPIA
jgi:putative copper export protein